MAEDALIVGAAAPAGTRRIRSAAVLDSIWVLLVAGVVVVSSFFALIDLPNRYLRTQDAPLRVYVVVVPAVAVALAVAAIIRRSVPLAAVATGTLVPAVALCGSLGASLFLDAASPFTDAGVPLAVAAALLGIVMVIRWFVYATPPVPGVEPRPTELLRRGLLTTGLVLTANVVIAALADDPTWSASFVVSTACLLLAPLVVLAAAAVCSVSSNLVAAGACAAQAVAVVVATLDDGGIEIDSTLALRTGVIGLIALVVGAGVAIAGADRAVIGDEPTVELLDADDPDWRWSVDDDL
jgi:hypothetical protein